jgi:hypothetical protein
MVYRTVVVAVLLAIGSSGALAGPKEKSAAASAVRFEALRKLAGEWVLVGADGKPSEQIASSIRVTASGSVVEETMFPGTDHEMVTMYHLDGADLVLTHYCGYGNQPKMRAEPGKEIGRIVFKYYGGTNMKSEAAAHMHQAVLALLDDNHYHAKWTACQNGKDTHVADLNLVRKAK